MEKRAQGWTLGRIAEMVKGELHGPAGLEIERPTPADSDDQKGIAFAESPEYLAKAEASGVGALLLPPGLTSTKPYVTVEVPRMAFGMLLAMAQRPLPLNEGVHPSAMISSEATIAETASIGPYVVIEAGAQIGSGVKIYPFSYIGEGCFIDEFATIYPNVTLYQDVEVGARTIIHSGAVLGADGFGFIWDGKRRLKVPQVGRVVIGADVEIGAATTIDRATAGETTIGRGTKIDNLVQIGHNCKLGEDGVIAGLTGISGSCEVGDRFVLGGQCGLSDHAVLGDDITFAGRTATSQTIEEPGAYFGTPAQPFGDGVKAMLLAARLPEIVARLRKVEKQLAQLENK